MVELPHGIVACGDGPLADKRGVRGMGDYLVYVRQETKARFDARPGAFDAATVISLPIQTLGATWN